MTALTRSAGTCSIPNSNPASHTSANVLADVPGVFIAASDYVRALPDSISRWFPRHVHCLGTDGFGRSDSREALRDFFEVDARFIVLATLVAALSRETNRPRDNSPGNSRLENRP